MIKLNNEKYFSFEAQRDYFSVSQYKDFIGTMGMKGCEAMALAKIKGEWDLEPTTAMLVGSYVDAHFEGTLDVFCAQHPDIMTQEGNLRAEFRHADEVINRIERDEYFMKFMGGQKQVVLTGEIFGVMWKCKIDSLDPERFLTDLKVMRELTDSFWVKDSGYMSFVEYWGYDIQMAIYQKLVFLKYKNMVPPFIAAASKQKYPDIAIIGFTQEDLDNVLSMVEPNIQRIKGIKEGTIDPDRCGECDYCRFTKVLNRPVHFSELVLKI